MSWLCDTCGYENEFDDESQPTTCLCCGEPAPESKIIKARRELEAYHREEERKARLEELRRKQELRQQKVDRIVARITHVAKAIPVTAVAMVIIAFVWVGVSFHSEGMTMSAWNTQMHTNISAISLTGYPDKLKNNLVNISLSENKSVSFRNNYLRDNALIVLESMGSNLKQVGKRVPTIDQNIASSSSNMRLNWSVFWSRTKDNVQELIKTITIRKDGADD